MDRTEALEWLTEHHPKLAAIPQMYDLILDQCEKDMETGQCLVPTETPDGIKYTSIDSKEEDAESPRSLGTIPEITPEQVAPEPLAESNNPEETPETLSVTFADKVEIVDNNI